MDKHAQRATITHVHAQHQHQQKVTHQLQQLQQQMLLQQMLLQRKLQQPQKLLQLSNFKQIKKLP